MANSRTRAKTTAAVPIQAEPSVTVWDPNLPGPQPATTPESVHVQVVVNHDHRRKGDTGLVELTTRNRNLINRGYLRIIGGP